MKTLVCFGTRPEAVKMAPICFELKKRNIPFATCVTAQHREMLDQVLEFFEIVPDYDLNLMQKDQSLNQLSSRIFSGIDIILDEFQPDLVLVQGDTTTAFCVAMAAFYRNIKVGHVEAGLRTYNSKSPYPEELNRQVISRIADFHFAPTQEAADNLKSEKISDSNIIITGNTIVDALNISIPKVKKPVFKEFGNLEGKLKPNKKIVLVTGHRRENFGQGIKNICKALLELSQKDDVQIIYPVHLNPQARKHVYSILGDQPDIFLINPVCYPDFIWLMKKASLIISDSGGVQEEAPTFKIPVLVTREFTERMEGVRKGYSFIVGTDKKLILDKARELLKNYSIPLSSSNPYGDGTASKCIIDYLENHY